MVNQASFVCVRRERDAIEDEHVEEAMKEIFDSRNVF